MTIANRISVAVLALLLVSCASRELEHHGDVDIKQHQEFESFVTVESPPDEAAQSRIERQTIEAQDKTQNTDQSVKAAGSKVQAKKPRTSVAKGASASAKKAVRGEQRESKSRGKKQSDRATTVPPPLMSGTAKTIEDRQGFIGRRPKVDPYFPGEEVELDVSYFGVSAGTLKMGTKPYAKVNGRKAYHFYFSLNSNDVFSRIYSAEDVAETYVDFLELLPLTFEVHLKETKRLQEGRAYFDWQKMVVTKWEKKLTPDDGATEKKISWEIDPYVQNVFSAPFYMRAFTLFPGKKISFRVADDGKNVTFKGEIVRQESLETDAGTFDTLVLKPQIIADGAFKQDGDILFWLTNDEQKLIVGFEGKIKVGKIRASLKGIKRGTRPEN